MINQSDMRSVLSVSLPSSDVRQIRKISKNRGYASLSAYIKALINADQELISETELLESVKLARKEYRAGKSIKANSIADLL